MARKLSPDRTAPTKSNGRTVSDARQDLLERAGQNAEGAMQYRGDPLADAEAARAVVEAAQDHAAELGRRGLSPAYGAAALQLAQEIEEHLQALPAAAVTARGRSQETAELLADAAGTAQTVRDAVLRICRGPDGRRAARDFGVGEPFSARQPAHVARAIERILSGLERHPDVRADLGVLPEDVQTLQDLAGELGRVAQSSAPISDEQAQLYQAQRALRAFFDLVAAKAALALAGDPDERGRLLSLIPRAEERRHLRREPTRAASA